MTYRREDFKPGAVAMVRFKGGEPRKAFRVTGHTWHTAALGGEWRDGEVTDARLLDETQLIDAETDAMGRLDGLSSVAAYQAALRSLLTPEPTGLGAVVEDADGERWVRVDDPDYPWSRAGGSHWTWARVDAVRQLSEGVQ